MFIEQYMKWKQGKDWDEKIEDLDKEQFFLFAEDYLACTDNGGYILNLMYQVYCLQCCMEGIIEDMEAKDEREEEAKKGKKGNGRVEGRGATQWVQGRTSC